MDTSEVAIVSLAVTGVTTFLGTIATMFYSGWKEGRQRRWDLEDRDKVHAKLDGIAADTKEGVVAAKAAFEEANNVNHKIEDLNKESIKTNQRASETEQVAGERLDAIDKVGVDTNGRIRKIEAQAPDLEAELAETKQALAEALAKLK